MNDDMVELYQHCIKAFSDVRVMLTELMENARSLSIEDAVDLAYVLRESGTLIDATRKEVEIGRAHV